MKARNALIPLALFALAFVGSLFALRGAAPSAAAGPARGATTTASLRVASAVRAEGVAESRAGRRTATGAAAIFAGVSAKDTSVSTASPAAAFAAVASRAAGHSAGAAGNSPAASNAAPAAEVAAALPELPPSIDGPLPSVTESYALLKNSGTPEERARAIQVISDAARGGMDVARARHALRWAAGDTDPDVAARAQEAYEHLLERDER